MIRTDKLASSQKPLVVLSAIFSLTAGVVPAAATSNADDEPIRGTIRVVQEALCDMAKIDPGAAKESAISALKRATVKEAKLEVEDDYLVYAVDVLLGAERIELIVDAGDGRILAVGVEDDDDDDDDDAPDR